MKILPSCLLPLALLAASAFLSPVRGQPPAPAAPLSPPERAVMESIEARSQAAKPGPTLSLDFPGGTLGDLIALVGKTNSETALNVIGEKAALATEVQPFSVRNADRDAILLAIGQLLRSKGVRLDPVTRGVFVASTEPRDRRPVRAKPETVFDSFQLGSYIDDQQSVDNIVDAIRTAWSLNPAHDANALQIKYHPATKLLLLSGPPEAVDMTRQVIRSLHENRKPRGGPPLIENK